MGWIRDVCFVKNGGEILMVHNALRVSSQAASTPCAIRATLLESTMQKRLEHGFSLVDDHLLVYP